VLGWLVNGGQNWEMKDMRGGGGLKPDRHISCLLYGNSFGDFPH
jgi:hypothetical protein